MEELFARPQPSDLDRTTILLELGVVVLLVVGPGLASVVLLAPLPVETLADGVYGAVWSLGEIALVSYLLWRDRGSLLPFGVGGRPGWELGMGLLLAVALLFVMIASSAFVTYLTGDTAAVETRTSNASSSPVAWSLFFLISAAGEEMVFRCYLWIRLVDLTGRPGWSLLAAALLFTAVHGYPLTASITTFLFGCVLGFYYWCFRRLPRLVVGHWVNNLVLVFGWV